VNTTRIIGAVALATTAALTLGACATSETPASGVDASTATSIADFGSFEALEEAAKAEGALNVIALPRDWANYGEILDLFIERYPEITVTEAAPDASSAEEIQAAENLRGQDTAPDVFDLGLAVALQSTDYFAPYFVERWDDIPAELKHPDAPY